MPTDWGTSADITIQALDVGCGITGYALTTSSTTPAGGWQDGSSFTITANGTYYVWVKDGAGNTVSQQFTFNKIDSSPPSVSYITVPTSWGASSTVTISATDASSGITAYAVTSAKTAPSSGWQDSKSIEITANGTYFAWAQDAVGNVSAGYEFTVTKVDSEKPIVSAVTVPNEWATTNKVTLAASDLGGSGLSAYAVTTTDTAPGSGWQSGTSFTLTVNGTYYAWAKDGAGNISVSREFVVSTVDTARLAAYAVTNTDTEPTSGWQTSKGVEVTANGKYFAWAKDAVGNVSAGYEFTVIKVDSTKPEVSAVSIPTDWATSSAVTVSASDTGSGIAAYAVTTSSSVPGTGWQTDSSFTLSANGTYYAWAKDNVGNISAAYKFTVSKVDITKPIVDSVAIPTGWGGSSTVTVSASDAGSGIAAYAITTGGSSAPSAGWQDNSSFTFSANGTFYAWAKDNAGNVSAGYQFTVDKIDNTAPAIAEITVPEDWAVKADITVMATDAQTGVTAYALTQSSTVPANGWQSSPGFTITTNGTYYAWAKDGAGNTAYKYFSFSKIDITAPSINSVSAPTDWAATNTVTISANDSGSGVIAYAVTNTDTVPSSGWQAEKAFEIAANGKYFAWAKDAVGNASIGYEFTVSKVDNTKPVVSAVTIPEAWGTNSTVTISATDVASDVATYTVTKSGTAPTDGWQTSNSFALTANGTYYAWVKDNAGNVSAAYEFTVSKVNITKPTVDSVTVPTIWNSSSTVTIYQ